MKTTLESIRNAFPQLGHRSAVELWAVLETSEELTRQIWLGREAVASKTLEICRDILEAKGVEDIGLFVDGKAVASYVDHGNDLGDTVVYDRLRGTFHVVPWRTFLANWQDLAGNDAIDQAVVQLSVVR